MHNKTASITCSGGREHNEDSIALMELKNKTIAIVADGLGGHGGGEAASSSAVRAASEYLTKEGIFTTQSVQDAVTFANNAVKAHPCAKTTIAILCLDGHVAISAHVGDSRVYQFRDGKIIFQSMDHSVSQMAVAVGEITNDEIRGHADRNKLLRAVDGGETIHAEICELSAEKKDAFLLCSDGFWELVTEDEMERDLARLHDAKTWLERMSERVKKRQTNKSDNYSAITITL